MVTKRTVDLAIDDIDDAIKELKQLKKELKPKVDKKMEKLLDEAVTYCMKNTPLSDKQGNHLRFNTYWERTPKGYRIVQEGDNIAYVEFGTGVVGAGLTGKSTPHPVAEEIGWKYGEGTHIFTTKDGKRGWFYPTGEMQTSLKTGKTSEVHKFTQGQPANAQMWKTAEFLESKLDKDLDYTVVEVVNKVGNNN